MAARKLVMPVPDYKFCRRLSGVLFLSGNATLFFTNIVNTNILQLLAGLLFMSCSIGLILSARNHRYLFYCAMVVVTGYILVALSTTGDGVFFKYMGGLAGVVGGLLILRGAFQRETKKQMNLPFPLNLVDQYPLAGTGIIEGICCLLTAIGSAIGGDFRMTFVAFVWVIAHGFLIASDEYLRARLTRIKP